MTNPKIKSLFCAGLLGASASLVGACGGDDGGTPPAPDARGPLFTPKPECEGDAIEPFAGSPRVIISHLEIGDLEDGFDLDGDGDPDNKLAAVGNLAGDAIDDAFDDYSLMIPFEFFDFPAAAPDACVKFAIYLGAYAQDLDGDGDEVAKENGDCNDHDAMIKRGAAEVAGNLKDDDCDGLADEAGDGTPSTDTADADSDGVTIADGDCDDTNPAVKGPGFPEICGDGYDNDCDGTADRGTADDSSIECNPYDAVDPEPMPIDPLSFDGAGDPLISFTSGETTTVGSALQLNAGPSLFQVTIPVTDDLNLDLKLTGTSIEADVVEDAVGVHLTNGRIGGIIDVQTADTIRGLDVEQIGLTPENSLLDAIFANLLGPLLALPSLPMGTVPFEGCRTPDIDVDGDGLEAFCDSNLDDDIKAVDVCIDGDGTVVMDTAGTDCSTAVDAAGNPRFVDGVSVALKFEAATAGEFVPPAAP
ncbi:MAG: putative metal-binding motif-containing protein [Kofleriaceae bacterium]